MKALKMTIAIGRADCVRTCIASLLDCERADDVPHFFEHVDDGWKLADNWLRLRDNPLALLFMHVPGEIALNDVLERFAFENPHTYYMLVGNNPNGRPHCVVCLHDKIIHDPAWGSFGIVGPSYSETDQAWVYQVVTFIPAFMVE